MGIPQGTVIGMFLLYFNNLRELNIPRKVISSYLIRRIRKYADLFTLRGRGLQITEMIYTKIKNIIFSLGITGIPLFSEVKIHNYGFDGGSRSCSELEWLVRRGTSRQVSHFLTCLSGCGLPYLLRSVYFPLIQYIIYYAIIGTEHGQI